MFNNTFFGPFPSTTIAYHKDGSNNEYFGEAPKGAATSSSMWKIVKQEYTGNNWVLKYPNGSDEPKFIWDNVESLTYKMLGT